jgi:hypothetical protein
MISTVGSGHKQPELRHGTQSRLPLCKRLNVVDTENKHLEDSPSSDVCNCSKRQAVSRKMSLTNKQKTN